MTLQMLEYFVVVAKCLNISDAADILYVSQPAISRQIKGLEDELGLQLFFRTKPNLTITEAGNYMQKHIDRIVQDTHALTDYAHAYANVYTGLLSIGYPGHLELPIMTRILSKMAEIYPSCSFHFEQNSLDVLKEGLYSRLYDVLFYPLTNLSEKEKEQFECYTLESMGMVLAVSEQNPLSRKEHLKMSDLASERIISFKRHDSIIHSDLLINACRKAGFRIRFDHEISNFFDLMLLITANMGVAIIGAAGSELFYNGVKFIPLEGFLPEGENSLQIGMIWLKDNNNQALSAMKNLLDTYFSEITTYK